MTTNEHFEAWLLKSVRETERADVREEINFTLREYPDLVETHSWPEIRSLAEVFCRRSEARQARQA